MFNFKHFLAHLALVVSMIAAGGQAAATPIYHVNIDTSSLGSGPAFLGLYFLGLAGGPAATATVTDLIGALDGTADLTGAVTGGVPGAFVFSNANGGGELVQAIQLGGVFSFDVGFLMNAGSTGTTFGWALFDTTHYLGVDGDLGHFFLEPDAAIGDQVVVDNAAGQLSVVTEVMEPSTGALVLLGMLALAGRRRRGSLRF
ncbi:NF038129 family PEP-CTERM protein [Pseudoduganella sp. UC29_106]|uniref:NF038129 family PEP-CTERM protein n=1 Tax=Pseudoduganella sp. UC29_106 TaxID=3374553 RepID=UPI0037574733